MSRLGKLPLEFTEKVKVSYQDKKLNIKGPLGELSFSAPKGVEIELKDSSLRVDANFELSEDRMMAGTSRAIINNMINGVTIGFVKTLQLVGVGYRAQVSGQKLTLALGYSHPIEYTLPETVAAEVEGTTKISLKSCDKQLLGQTAAEIRKFRPPEPYKGKGILYLGEQIVRKAGKTAKSAK